MKLIRSTDIRKRIGLFEFIAGTSKSQVATMVLKPGQISGPYGNEHPDSDQILIVLDGEAHARVENESQMLGPGDVLVIEAGEKHQISCPGPTTLSTLNIYSPPGY